MTTSAFDPAIDDLIIASRKEIVFIEDNVADIDTLIKGIGGGKEIVILDSTQDGVHQIAQALLGRGGIDAVHIMSHGSEGALSLGTLMLDAGKLDAYKGDLQAIGQSMSAGGDILLYGCNVGAGNGAGFVQQLAIATGADVAASNDITGAASLGGDWNLEVASGQVGTAVAVDAQTAALYQNVLNISPGVIHFGNTGNFDGGLDPTDMVSRDTDVTYRVNGYGGYQLKIDGQDTAVSSYTSYVGRVFAGAQANESEITISFAAGQAFTAQSIALSNWSSVHTDQTLLIKGYDSHYNQVGTTVTANLHTSDFTATNIDLGLGGLEGQIVKMLKITATTAGGKIDYLMIDSLTVGTVTPYPPMVTYVTASPANGSFKAGTTIDIKVNFDNAVDVTGTPRLTLETGATDRVATYVSGSGSSELTFRYAVQAGDTAADLDYTNTAIALNGGTIKAFMSAQDAIVTLPTPGTGGSLSSNTSIEIDTTAPTLAITSNKSVLKAGDAATITFTFSETPSNFDASDIVVSGGTLSGLSGTGAVRTATFTPTANTNSGTASISVGASKYNDAAGNDNTAASNGPAITYDTLLPTVAVSSDKSTLKAGETATITFTFSEDPGATFTWTGSSGDVVVSGGTLSAISGSGLTRTATFAPTANTNSGSASISVNSGAFADAAGNVNTTGGSASLTYDTKAPTVAITSDKSVLKAGDTATITFTFSEDPGATFTWDGSSGDIAVSGGTLSAISGTGTTRTATFTPGAGFNNGFPASVTVAFNSYADAAGNLGGAGASPSIAVDTVAPNAPTAPSLPNASDSGSSNTDDYTNKNANLTFSGSTEVGVTVVKLYDGATEIGSTSSLLGQIYHITPAGILADGVHTLTTKAFDAAGNVSSASGVLEITIDTTAPTTTIASAAFSADTGSSATDMVTKTATPQTIAGTLSANLAAGEQVMVSLDNGASWSPATASAGSNTWELAVTLAGSGTLKVKVVDLAGNDGAVYAHAYVLDTTPPAAPSAPDLDAASDSGASDSDDITSVTLPSFSGTAEAGATVRLFDGGNEIGSDVAASDGSWHITTGSSFPMGERPHYITAIATDLAGNSSTNSAPLEVQVFTNGPTTTIASIALSNDSGAGNDFVTYTAAQIVSGTLSANLAAGQRVQVSLNGGTSWSDAAGAAGQNTWSLPVTLTDGSHAIQVRVIDAVDNTGPVYSRAYNLDRVKPTVSISSNVSQLKADETATITFTFSEDPGASFTWGGSSGDVTVSGGTLSAISGSGTIRTATFTPAADLNAGTASITVHVDSYADLAGNLGLAGAMPSLSFDTLAPAAPSAPDLHKDSDSGVLDTDNLTNNTTPVFTGTAEAGAIVRLYDSDGTTEIGHATAAGGNWTITTSTLLNGEHTVTAKAFDAAGNASAASSPLTIKIDSAKPAAMAAPAFKTGSDSGTAGDGITNVKKPVLTGSAEAFAQVTLYDGATALGTVNANAAGAWEFTPAADLLDGTHAISARQTDGAGNQSDAGTAFNLTIDTVALAAPAAPSMAAASDTDTVGDGVTENDMPVIEGTALANTLVTLYDIFNSGKSMIGSVMADGSGKWSIATAGLAVGAHSLSVTQTDAAGNESAHSASFSLRIDAPPVPVNLIDGVAVDIQSISLPGGVIGSAVSIPVVGAGRVDSSGQASVADIPLLTSSQGNPLLMAALPVGFGLSASGASVPKAGGAELLLAAIKAATPSHGAVDQGHLTANGQSFLGGLAAGGTLLVETVKPVSAEGAPSGVLTLSGPAQPQGQSTALVIDASRLGTGATIKLQDLNFAAVIGAANVVSTGSMILTGDTASQHFTVVAGMGSNAVLAGGGNDTLALSPPAAGGTGAGAVMLHGGSANDVAQFSGARADYNIAFHNAYVTVTSKSGPATTATVVNVETLQFSDGNVVVQNSADMSTLAGIYQTVLGRQADINGIEFWANGHQAGANWGNIALNMIGSSERLASHEGFNGVAAHDVTLLYSALFNRAPDAEGLAFWLNAIAHGVSLEHVADEFVKSAEMGGHLRGALDWDFINA
jgi:hypothetical protein